MRSRRKQQELPAIQDDLAIRMMYRLKLRLDTGNDSIHLIGLAGYEQARDDADAAISTALDEIRSKRLVSVSVTGDVTLTRLGKAWIASTSPQVFDAAKLPDAEAEELARRYVPDSPARPGGVGP